MIIFRAMQDKEADETLKYNSFSWNSRFKWFGTLEFVTSRVQDGKFNNSRFKPNRFNRLLKFEIDDASLSNFVNCGNNELMLNARKSPLVKILQVEDITSTCKIP